MSTQQTTVDPHAQLRRLYLSLLENHERFDEFRRLLGQYEVEPEHLEAEPEEAAKVRMNLNNRIREWVGAEFQGLGVSEMLLWRDIVVLQRFNAALSPWKTANMY
jgi:hypothetical protein